MNGFIPGEKESFMQDIQRLGYIVLIDDKRNITLRGALGNGPDVDTILTKQAEDFTSDS